MFRQMRLLAIDIGLGTTDILAYDSEIEMENCSKLVVPSRTQQVASAIRQATGQGRAVVFEGVTMGGGAAGKALKEHLHCGLGFFAGVKAALTFNDDLEKVSSWGVWIGDDPRGAAPDNSIFINSGDLEPGRLMHSLAELGVSTGFDGIAVAVQDHGFSPAGSNRKRRFQLWREAIADEPMLARLAYAANGIPEAYTRMQAVASLMHELPRVMVMDTGPAALLGALIDDGNGKMGNGCRCLVANIGNGHTLAAIIDDGRLAGLVEHHTRLMGGGRFAPLIESFASGELRDEDVYEDGGHGCIPPAASHEICEPIIVTGPRRRLASGTGLPLRFAAPYGDMMMTGCFGLLRAWHEVISGPSS